MIDISPAHLETVLRILSDHVPTCEVRAFGSRVTWTAKDYSDLDLAVVGTGRLGPDVMLRLKEAFEESDLPFRVDIIDWYAISDSFRKVIGKKYEIISMGILYNCDVENNDAPLEVENLIGTGKLLINDGYRAKNDELAKDGLPFARAGNVDCGFDFKNADCIPRDSLKKVGLKRSKAGDVVFTSKGTVGRFGFVRESSPEFVYSPQLCYWRSLDHTSIYPRWLYYWMQGREFFLQFKGVAGQTDMAEYVSLRDQRAMKITLRSLPTQKAIAHILGTLDDKIELNRKMNATLEAMARALFQSWFVDFDPVRAKLNGQKPTGMDAETAALFPDSFEHTVLGLTPKGWKVERFDAHITAERGLSYKGEGLCNDGEGLPMHNLNSIFEGGGYKHEGIKFYAGEYREKHLLKPGDMIVTNTEQGFDHLLIGHAAIVPECFGEEGLYSHHIYRVRHKSASPFNPHYLVELFNNRRWHYWISGFSNGTTINMLPMDALEMPFLVVPPTKLVAKFTSLATDAHSQVEANHAETRTLASLRDTLLPKLLSGELQINDAERFVSETV